MVLYTAPFPNSCLSALHAVSWALLFPCYWLADRLVASFIPTTYEKRQRADDPCYLQLLCTVLFTPVYLALLVASLPFAFVGFLLWSPLQSARRPYIYSRLEDKGPAGGAALLSEWKGTGPGKSFCFATANLCLLPDSLARLNNVFNTQARAKEIGQRIRNGASRPQIKIYIDSPTNTSISAASFSSLVSPQGSDGVARAVPGSIKRTASVEYKGDEAANGPASGEPAEGGSLEDACIVRIGGGGEEGGRPPEADDAATGGQARNGAGGAPQGQTPNHSQRDGDSGSLGSPSASRESLVKVRAAADSGGSGEPGATNSKLPYKASGVKKAAARKRRHPDEAFDHEVSAFFPANLDFLCLQEVFDKRAAAKLKDQLHGYFEYILYDVGVYGCQGCCSFKCLNSGLFFASRYPIMDVAYHCYPNGRRSDGLASKGALFLKRTVPSGVSSWTCFRTGWLISENLPPRPAQPTPRSWWHLMSSAEILTLTTAPRMTSWSSSTPCLHTTRTPAAWGPERRSPGPSVPCWTQTTSTTRKCAPLTICKRSWRARKAAGSTWPSPPARAPGWARRDARTCSRATAGASTTCCMRRRGCARTGRPRWKNSVLSPSCLA
ncbi:sphingomyelin phosphodiesterase 3 isoform X2 [Halichoerus grypus]